VIPDIASLIRATLLQTDYELMQTPAADRREAEGDPAPGGVRRSAGRRNTRRPQRVDARTLSFGRGTSTSLATAVGFRTDR
jgi:hypothetical protein